MHDLLHCIYPHLLQANYVHLLLVVFSAVDHFSIVEEIEKLSTVNLVKGDKKLQLRVVLQHLDDVVSSQQVEPWD